MAQVVDLPTAHSKAPTTENGKVAPPRRQANAERRPREYLTPDQIEALKAAASRLGRHKHRDRTLVLIMYRHALRVSEAVSLRWDQVDLKQGLLHVNRHKNGLPSVHPLRGPEIRALRRLPRTYPDTPYLLVPERDGPLSGSAVRKLIAQAAREASLSFPAHPPMLRHVTGYKLANDGHAIQHYLGHKNIQHTVRYTELSSERFNWFWKD